MLEIGPALLALIVLLQTLLVTIVTGSIAYFTQRQTARLKSAEKTEDWRRQDEVADRVAIAAKQAADAANALIAAQKETIKRTDEVAKAQVESDKRIANQLIAIDQQGKKIHILVNSDMTAARTAERNQTMLTIAALKRVQILSRKLGYAVDPTEEDEVIKAQERVEELNQVLADRLAAQGRVDAETKKEA